MKSQSEEVIGRTKDPRPWPHCGHGGSRERASYPRHLEYCTYCRTTFTKEAVKIDRPVTGHEINALNGQLAIKSDPPSHGNASHVYFVHATDDTPYQPDGTRYYETIRFQNGPVKEHGVNGLTNEVLLAIVADRLRGFQSGPYACHENQQALDKVTESLHWLHERTHHRVRRGVEGTSKKTPLDGHLLPLISDDKLEGMAAVWVNERERIGNTPRSDLFLRFCVQDGTAQPHPQVVDVVSEVFSSTHDAGRSPWTILHIPPDEYLSPLQLAAIVRAKIDSIEGRGPKSQRLISFGRSGILNKLAPGDGATNKVEFPYSTQIYIKVYSPGWERGYQYLVPQCQVLGYYGNVRPMTFDDGTVFDPDVERVDCEPLGELRSEFGVVKLVEINNTHVTLSFHANESAAGFEYSVEIYGIPT